MTARRLTPSLLLQLLVVASAAGARWRGEGTTRHLQSIILGRCAEYDALVNPDPRGRNCTAIWEAFKVVLVKDPCSVLPSDYDRFIDLSRHSIPRDKSLFWENNHLLVTSYSENGLRFLPLCSVLYGRIGDFLSWCRQENASGLDYQSCPTSEDCENNAVDSFWKRASMQYARESSGVISVMLNGSEPSGAYPVKGFFADFEIPYFQKDKITRIEIWVMHEIGKPKVEENCWKKRRVRNVNPDDSETSQGHPAWSKCSHVKPQRPAGALFFRPSMKSIANPSEYVQGES
ncbi:ADP-ribosyl cyclase/cyclic ADP-ribose hydrolase 2 isoform X2 [Neovison vison]|uniref:ADP-ribosyl cyclase/cyclic ADP-ribose hydrolase 2 isoform X2 n=1 Tax=Neovison vison TaxID=452646 RepID=UPI001CF021C5|nr:ADP-ribosyl cyclase/cyclic ADP-ribose hydrolase 2 isoform X2 [Neogale vison]